MKKRVAYGIIALACLLLPSCCNCVSDFDMTDEQISQKYGNYYKDGKLTKVKRITMREVGNRHTVYELDSSYEYSIGDWNVISDLFLVPSNNYAYGNRLPHPDKQDEEDVYHINGYLGIWYDDSKGIQPWTYAILRMKNNSIGDVVTFIDYVGIDKEKGIEFA